MGHCLAGPLVAPPLNHVTSGSSGVVISAQAILFEGSRFNSRWEQWSFLTNRKTNSVIDFWDSDHSPKLLVFCTVIPVPYLIDELDVNVGFVFLRNYNFYKATIYSYFIRSKKYIYGCIVYLSLLDNSNYYETQIYRLHKQLYVYIVIVLRTQATIQSKKMYITRIMILLRIVY